MNFDLINRAAAALSDAIASSSQKPSVFVGMDGFIDEIVHVVDQRKDVRTYTPIRTIADYAARLAQAAGKSTNVELVLQQVKMGGNGPLLSDALGRLGLHVTTVGALGTPVLHPAFERLRDYGPVVSVTPPAVTIAAEFDDGKIMHGMLEPLNEILYPNIVKAFGSEAGLLSALRSSTLIALINWTMIPNLTQVWRDLLDQLLALGNEAPRFYFFDLCDPQKRSRDDLREALSIIARMKETGGLPILGLNEKESVEVCEALGLAAGDATHEGLMARARLIATRTGIPEIVIHPRTFAVASGPAGAGAIDGPVCRNPYLTTGAGDSFNGGYCLARLYNLPPELAIVVGKGVSGFYVREGRAPNTDELHRFFTRWIDDTIDPWTRS